METKYKRQVGIIDIEAFRKNKITIVGCGAIGSFIGMSLAKMGLTWFELWDSDNVEEHNLPNQFFDLSDIGDKKVMALKSHMNAFNDECTVSTVFANFGKNNSFINTKIVISAVDKMDARKTIFNACKNNKKIQLFIDTRMHSLQSQAYFIDMNNKEQIKNYEKTLFTNEEAVEGRCTERSIIYTVLGIASLACSQIVKALKGEEIKNYIVLDYSMPQMIA